MAGNEDYGFIALLFAMALKARGAIQPFFSLTRASNRRPNKFFELSSTKNGSLLKVTRDLNGDVTGFAINGQQASESNFQAFASALSESYNDRFEFDTLAVNRSGTTLSGLPGQTVYFKPRWGAPLTTYASESTSLVANPKLETERVLPDFRGQFSVKPDTYTAKIEFSDESIESFASSKAFPGVTRISVQALRTAELQLSNNGSLDFMPSLKSLVVESAGSNGTADLSISASAENSPLVGDGSGAGFLDQLETIRVIGNSSGGGAAASLSLSHDGSINFMKSLRSITMVSNGQFNSCDFSLSASTNDYRAAAGVNLTGDNFMPSLETISMRSNGDDASLSISSSGGAYFMRSLRTIDVYAEERLEVSISASANSYAGEYLLGNYFMSSLVSIRLESVEDTNSLSISHSGGNYFMQSLKSITQISVNGRVEISISASANVYHDTRLRSDNFMIGLETITMSGLNERVSLSISASGGINFMESLRSVDISGGQETLFSVSASTNYTGARGNNFMESLQTIKISRTGDLGDYRLELSLDNEGGANFMKSLQTIDAQILNGKATVNLRNREDSSYDDQEDNEQTIGNNFMESLTAINFNIADFGIADLNIRSDEGSDFLSELGLIKLDGYYASIDLVGMFGDNEGMNSSDNNHRHDIVIDTTNMGASNSFWHGRLVYATTHELSLESDISNRSIVIKVGVTDIQYNAVLEIDDNYFDAGAEFVSDDALFDLFYDDNQYNDQDRLDRFVSDYKSYGSLEVFLADADNEFDSFERQFISGWGVVDVGNDNAEGGFESIGSNGVQDIFTYISTLPGDVVVGGYDNGLDKFDFSQISNLMSGNVIDSTDSTDYVQVNQGDILVTQSFLSSEDAIIWLNISGGTTNAFEDFESWIYVDKGATYGWNQSDFMF